MNKLIYIFLIAISFASCESLVDDVNDNPNRFTENPPAKFLVNTIALNVSSLAESNAARYAAMFSDQMQGCDRQYLTANKYSVTSDIFDEVWAEIYYEAIGQAPAAIEQATAEGNNELLGIIDILKGYFFAEGAILFGDIPFSEAANFDEYPDPRYEDQREVILGAIALIDSGKALVGDVPMSATSTSSILTSGSSTWGQFAEGLKARYYITLGDYDNALSAAQSAGINTVDGNVVFNHSAADGGENLWFQFEAEQRGGYICFDGSTLESMLTADSDRYKGNDKTDESARKNSLMVEGSLNVADGAYFGKSTAAEILTASEVNLIIAEILARDGDLQGAVDALNAARTNVENTFGGTYDAYELDDFGPGAMVEGEDQQDAILLEVLREKFATVIGLPTFADLRRTDNAIGVAIKSSTGSTIPQRFLYPSSEASSNDNFPGLIPLFDKLKIFQ